MLAHRRTDYRRTFPVALTLLVHWRTDYRPPPRPAGDLAQDLDGPIGGQAVDDQVLGGKRLPGNRRQAIPDRCSAIANDRNDTNHRESLNNLN